MNEFIESFLSKPIFVFTLIAFAITCLWVMIESRKQILFVSFFIPLFLFLTFYTYITIQSIEGYATEQKIQKEFTLHWYTIEENKFDACVGGARRDEEKARAKERFFSHRDDFSQWDPKNQRPELWNLFNGMHAPGEHFRVFPLNNWTELDVWNYILREKITLPSLYFSHKRECIKRDGQILANSDYLNLKGNETPEMMQVRFRTLGDLTITGAFESNADSLEKIIEEVAATRITERGGRMDDKRSSSAMEDRKKDGYF